MRGSVAGVAGFGAVLMIAPAAQAGINEAYVGVMAHDVCVYNCKNAGKEPGPAVEFEVAFDSPRVLRFIGSPEPYAVASVNVAGATSFAGGGLEWHWRVAPNWSIDPGFGYVLHNGETNNPYPNGSPQAAQFNRDHVLLGSRDLFRISLGVTRELAGPWSVQAFYSHLSHGQVIGRGRNQGLDQIGLRLGYRFDD